MYTALVVAVRKYEVLCCSNWLDYTVSNSGSLCVALYYMCEKFVYFIDFMTPTALNVIQR